MDGIRERKTSTKILGSPSDRDSPSSSSEPGRRSSVRRSVAILLTIFIASMLIMSWLFFSLPQLDDDDLDNLKFPTSLDAAKDLGKVLSRYKNTHYYSVLGAIVFTYIFLQTFAIPGSIFFSILSGFMFPFPLALFLVCMCSALGATFCYFLSALVGEGLMRKFFPQRLKSWKAQVDSHHDNMLWYIIFLRITPFLPNWFINLASPILGVRVVPFFLGTFLGVAPPSFFFISAGTTLYQLSTATGHLSLTNILLLALMACLSLLPVLFKKLLRNKME